MSSNSQVPSCIEWIICIFCWEAYSFFRATTKTQNRGNPPFLFLLEIDSCRAATAGERDFFILRHGFLRGGIPIFLTVGLGGDREADQQWCDGKSMETRSKSRDRWTRGICRQQEMIDLSKFLTDWWITWALYSFSIDQLWRFWV